MKTRFFRRSFSALGGILATLFASLLIFFGVQAAAGTLLWENEVDRAGYGDAALKVVAHGRHVYAAGAVGEEESCFATGAWAGDCDFYIRKVEARTGNLLWEDQVAATTGLDMAFKLTVHGGRVFASGVSGPDVACNVSFGTGDCDYYLRALDTNTGELLWEDQHDEAGGNDGAWTLEGRGNRLFVSGWVQNADGDFDFLVRAYDAATGSLIWEDRFDSGGNDGLFDLAVDGRRVFVVGNVAVDPFCTPFLSVGDCRFYVRALDARTGAVLWENLGEETLGSNTALRVVAHRGLLFVAGFVGVDSSCDFGPGNCDFYVQALDAATGALIWEDRVDKEGSNGVAWTLAVEGERLFAVGRDAGHFLVRAYDSTSGSLLWEDLLDIYAGTAWDVAAQGGQVFAAGGVWAGTSLDFIVRAYDAASGALLWEDLFDKAGGFDQALSISSGGGRVFAAGSVENAPLKFNFILRAYASQ